MKYYPLHLKMGIVFRNLYNYYRKEQNYMKQQKFLRHFFEIMEKRNVYYTETEKQNFMNLYNALETQEVKQVQIFNIPMAEGKSTFLKEYCKFKLESDKNFAIAIVNKTIKECIETCIDIGLRKEFQQQYQDMNNEQLYKLYRGKLRTGYYKQEPQPDCFNAITISGFNYEDCLEYSQHKKHLKRKTVVTDEKIAELMDFFHEIALPLDNSLCLHCERNCIKKKTRQIAKKHKIVLISHSRLLNSIDSPELLKDVLYYENENGEKIKRKLLVVDEKLAMADIQRATMLDIIKLKNFIEEKAEESDVKKIKAIYEDLQKLNYAMGKEICLNDIKGKFFPLSLTEETKKEILKKGQTINDTFLFLENLYKYDVCVTSQVFMSKKNEKRELTIGRYVDLLKYTKDFGNIILLDATADIDIEYTKSKVSLQNNIVRIPRPINLCIPTSYCNLSKSTINNHVLHRDSKIIVKMAKECDQIIEETGLKTLIVTYKSFSKYGQDLKIMLADRLTSNKDMYKIIHFGQFTTGVNFLSDYENIIFLGQLRKNPAYYLAKSIVLSDNKHKYTKTDIMCNEMLVDTIQQIGRTSYRNSNIPNVYIFDNEEITEHIRCNLDQYFDIRENDYENNYLFQERKEYTGEYKRDKESYLNKFLEFLYYFLVEDVKKRHLIDNEYIFKISEIKQAIGYKRQKFW